MTKPQKPRKKLITNRTHPLLQCKDVQDTLLRETEDLGLPADVRQAFKNTRDVCWRFFVESQEKLMAK